MSSILIGIPTIREDKNFWDSMRVFLPAMNKIYDIEIVEVRNKQIAYARNLIVEMFLQSDKDYLLFLDDDHSGHTIEMVEALFKPGVLVCAIKCYARFFPHFCTLGDYSGLNHPRGRYQFKDLKSGYERCDLVGFGMTLIDKQVFSKLSIPCFAWWPDKAEDNYFCEQLLANDVRPMGCFDYVLTHNGVDDSNLEGLRNRGLDAVITDIKTRGPYNNERILIVV